jgi:hypothetical protein
MRGTLAKYIGISATIFAFSLLITGCGQSSSGSSSAGTTVLSIPTEFQSYVSDFQQLAADNNTPVTINNLVIQFGTLSQSAEMGECDIAEGTPPTITIDQDYWNSSDENTRKTLIYHELGHCVLHRLHRTSITSGGYPISLMNAYTVSGVVYEAETAYYNQELFTNENQF